jgi:hypothetical protein
MLVMDSMVPRPAKNGPLQCRRAEDKVKELQRPMTVIALVGEMAMISGRDPHPGGQDVEQQENTDIGEMNAVVENVPDGPGDCQDRRKGKKEDVAPIQFFFGGVQMFPFIDKILTNAGGIGQRYSFISA